MTDQSYVHFIERNRMIPLAQLNSSPAKPADLNVNTLKNLLKAEGLRTGDFYFNPLNPELPYCYYHGTTMLEFDLDDINVSELKTLIERTEKDINESVAKRDFDRFFTLVDARLAPELYVEVFNFIPDQDKFRVFERLWRFNPYSQEIFSEDFIRRVSKYKGVTSDRPVADEHGYVKVYGSWETDDPSDQDIWTADVNRAIFKILGFQPAPPVYQGRLHVDQIISFNNTKSIREVVVSPHQVKEIRAMDLVDLVKCGPELRKAGVVDRYQQYAGLIDIDWFHNPQGIHAVGHTKRVLLMSLMIAYWEGFDLEETDLLCLAAVYHDIGRTNDGYDPDHGLASYVKMTREKLSGLSTCQEQETLRFLVENHAIPDQTAYKKLNRYELGNVNKTLRLFDSFKDADGLDRVRLRDLNPEYLRTKAAHRLLLAAHQLYSQVVVY